MERLYKEIFRNSEELDSSIYKEFLAKQLILRDYLAIERTVLTNEATFLAYIRTSLTVMVVGITLFQISPNNETFQYVGILLALCGAFTFLLGAVRTLRMRGKINKFLRKKNEIEKLTNNSKTPEI